MGGLLTVVLLIEEAKLTLQVMGIQGFQKAHADGLAALLLATAHLVSPVGSAVRVTLR